MPLLKPAENSKKESITLNLSAAVWQKTIDYCDWAKFENTEEFVEQAIEFILKKDREWKQYQATAKMQQQSSEATPTQ